MSQQRSTKKYERSMVNYTKYPLNLAYGASNNGSLLASRTLLLDTAPDLFYKASRVRLLELKNTQVPENSVGLRTLRTEEDFRNWLAVPNADADPPVSEVRCRFVFLQAESGQAKLDVSLINALRIFTYFQVMPSYIGFISAFAKKRRDQEDISDLRFSSFRESMRLSQEACGLDLPHLALSGHGYQLSYNLKSVANTSREKKSWPGMIDSKEKWSWSIRQAAFHHQFDMKEGTTLWIFTSAREYLQDRVLQLTGQAQGQPPMASSDPTVNEDLELEARPCDRTFTTAADSFIASLSVHLMIAQYASEDWRGYIRWLEQMVEKETKAALRDDSYDAKPFDLILVQVMEDRINQAVLTLGANARVLDSLEGFYKSLLLNEDFDLRHNKACKQAILEFSVELCDYIYDAKMFSDRAITLAKITADRKSLIQQHLQARATDRVEKLTIQQQKEAKIMRVIAVLTLIYLPATFSSTFFSTDIVKYQADGSEPADYNYTSYSGLALERWFEVTVPLTVLTFVVAGGWYYCWDAARLAWNRWRKRPYLSDVDDEEMVSIKGE